MANILIVEDDRATALMLSIFVKALGHVPTMAADGTAGLQIARESPQDMIISDVMMAPMDGWELMKKLREHAITTPVVMLSADTNADTATRARAAGAVDFLSKPMKLEEVRRCVDRAVGTAKAAAKAPAAPNLMAELTRLLPGAAYLTTRESLARMPERPRAFLEAETGMVGQELFEMIHEHGPMRDGPVEIRHLAKWPLDETQACLLDEEGKLGPWFQSAKKGTLVLISIESLPLAFQAKLSHALRNYPGGHIIVSTLGDPDALIAKGLLDESLHFRFATFSVRLPPLRECEPHLVDLFRICLAQSPGFVFGSLEIEIEDPVARAVRVYSWPENLAEMRQTADSTVARLRSPRVTMAQLPEHFLTVRLPTLAQALLAAQAEHIGRAQRIFQNASEAAEALGVSLRDVDAFAAGSREPLFNLGKPVGATTNAPFAAAAPCALFVIGEPVLRAAFEVSISPRNPRFNTAPHALGALALVTGRPDAYADVVLVGSDSLLTSGEISAQLQRIASHVKLTVMSEAGPQHTLPEIEQMLVQLARAPAKG